MSTQKITVPDIGDAEDVEVIEVCVASGDEVAVDDILIVVESDKASMEIPCPVSGKVTSLAVKLGDNVSFDSVILTLELGVQRPDPDPPSSEPRKQKSEKPVQPSIQTISVPDIGDSEAVIVIELMVKSGDSIDVEDLLVVVESDKASMEIPSPFSGVVEKMLVKEGDEVTEGSALLTILSHDTLSDTAGLIEAETEVIDQTDSEEVRKSLTQPEVTEPGATEQGRKPETALSDKASVYAGPAVRKLAREMGVNLVAVNGTGAGGRITKDDVHTYVKAALTGAAQQSSSGIPTVPAIDFSKYGDTEILPLSRIRKRGAANLHRSWLNVPHVTQNDEADVTDLEDFRKRLAGEAKRKGVRLTPLAFIIKAVSFALNEFPIVNSSLDPEGKNYILKKYCNIGMAVDTPDGLVVPVIKQVDIKGVWQIAGEVVELSEKARLGKLSAIEMQGASFTISSLGPIGGTSFTPIVNTPEVAILGVSKLSVKPQWDGENFVPRKMLPVSFSYDHRAINGAEAGRFTTFLCAVLKDFREGIM